ncbi:MAG: glycoside hydrolase family 20 zincin-like fold domain-containing protein, partial [Bacteroidales bacterium]|nr:glycoside hydrolase family 20 zincin-like fold domain-containing protein [Bacteroidales bacterium]
MTPKPKQMTVGEGSLSLPDRFVVSCSGLDEAERNEVDRFVADYNVATGSTVTVAEDDDAALMQVSLLTTTSTRKDGAYNVKVTQDQVSVKGKGALGLFYAFQTIKKMLPPHVMAGVSDPNVTAYSLPVVSIVDEPRFEYRGFMLDVSRHFFSVEEVKRMLDVM